MFGDTDSLRLIAAMRAHGVTTIEIKAGDEMLRLVLPPQAAEAAAPSAPPLAPALSPDIGAFLPRGSDDGLTPLDEGDHVCADEVLGYVARDALRAAITAPAAGRLVGPMPKPGTILGYGDAVLHLEQS